MKKSRPPKHLTAEARRWYSALAEEYAIEDPGGRLLLQTAAEAFQRMREAQARLDADGLTIEDRFGQPKPHPAHAIERDSRAQMLAALRALNLDIEPLRPAAGRPPGGWGA